MKIEWNKVTWYSKALALAVFVLMVFAGFYVGVVYGVILRGSPTAVPSATPSSAVTDDYYQNVSEWQTDQDGAGGFTIAYPTDFAIDANINSAPSTDWSLNVNGASGVKDLSVTVPSAFEPQTNFADATLTVGRSSDKTALKNCLQIPQNAGITSNATVDINGVPFLELNSNSAGAGNFYETTGYYAVHAGQCYAIEYTIHSSDVGNWPASYNLQPFDQTSIKDVLNRIVGTFKFD